MREGYLHQRFSSYLKLVFQTQILYFKKILFFLGGEVKLALNRKILGYSCLLLLYCLGFKYMKQSNDCTNSQDKNNK